MLVPELTGYFPSKGSMDSNQLAFYKELESKLGNGDYLDVEGNIGYVFVYLYDLLSNWHKKGFESLSEYLIYISELYKKDEKLSSYCLFWAYDCLLGLKRYEEFLEKTEPKQPFGRSTAQSDLRLNIQNKLGLEANPIDVLLMHGGRKSKFLTDNQPLYIEKIRDIFSSYAMEKGGWFKILKSFDKSDKWQSGFPHTLFNGAPLWENRPELEFKVFSFFFFGHTAKIEELSRMAENQARKDAGVHQIGEGWVSETMLFRKLESEFSITTVIPHGQPKWLGRQHFDIWMPNWKIAVEYHGKQHFEPVDFFGGQKAFEKNLERDNRKLELAKKNETNLFVITEDDNQDELIDNIYKIIGNRKIPAPIIEISDKVYSCLGCGASFKTIEERLKHHTLCEKFKEKLFVCNGCDQDNTLDDFQLHELNNNEKTKVDCNCSYATEVNKNTNHDISQNKKLTIKKETKGKDSQPRHCSYCGSVFQISLEDFPRKRQEVPFVCPNNCPENTNATWALTDDEYSCKGCNMAFDTIKEKFEHQKICKELKGRFFLCKDCNYAVILSISELENANKTGKVKYHCYCSRRGKIN